MTTPYPDEMQDMQVTLRNIQRQTVTFTLPACGAAGLALLLAAAMFAIIPLIWQVSKSSYVWLGNPAPYEGKHYRLPEPINSPQPLPGHMEGATSGYLQS